MKKQCQEKDHTIEEMKKQIEALTKENQLLKEQQNMMGGSYKLAQSTSPKRRVGDATFKSVSSFSILIYCESLIISFL